MSTQSSGLAPGGGKQLPGKCPASQEQSVQSLHSHPLGLAILALALAFILPQLRG